jgi:hypothetical protein
MRIVILFVGDSNVVVVASLMLALQGFVSAIVKLFLKE